VKLHCFAGLALPDVAEILAISHFNAEADWTYAKD
jgi:hypothetical protein